jgi:hypothetical protein
LLLHPSIAESDFAALSVGSRSARFLSRLERQRIATLRGQGLGVREIARRI